MKSFVCSVKTFFWNLHLCQTMTPVLCFLCLILLCPSGHELSTIRPRSKPKTILQLAMAKYILSNKFWRDIGKCIFIYFGNFYFSSFSLDSILYLIWYTPYKCNNYALSFICFDTRLCSRYYNIPQGIVHLRWRIMKLNVHIYSIAQEDSVHLL